MSGGETREPQAAILRVLERSTGPLADDARAALAALVEENDTLRAALVEAEEEIVYVLDEFNRGDIQDAEESVRVARKIIRAALGGGGDAQ